MADGSGAMVTPRQSRSELSTTRLINAAAELIAENGYERTTLAAIGKRAGYSHGIVTRRFGSKEGLLVALIEKMAMGWTETHLKPAVGSSTGREALHIRVDAFRASWRKSARRMRALYTLMFEALGPIPHLKLRMIELHGYSRESVAAVVQLGIDNGTVDGSVDAERVARLFVGALRGAAYQAMLDPDAIDIYDALDDLDLLVDSLLPAPSSIQPRSTQARSTQQQTAASDKKGASARG